MKYFKLFESFLNEAYKFKFKLGDWVYFDKEKVQVMNAYTTRGGKAMYKLGSSKIGDIDIEAEDVELDPANKKR